MKKHIGFIIGNLDGNGGTERVSTMLANRFAEHGYQVSFISPRSKGNVFFIYMKIFILIVWEKFIISCNILGYGIIFI